ncbi:MAG: DUF3307 domain-containing protein [Caldilineaceae bacterium]|nr:DUF3307 domain-containing protein [Caldilineaceae bacterium]MCB0145060.1 DUF3307 domain-containing protein [Caldilineaceae bacterium]
MQDATVLLVWGAVIHLVADWLLQTDWMALHKTSLRHPAAWIHSAIHAAGLCLVFAWPLALGIGLTHLLIDTRKPLIWWMRQIKRIPPDTHSMIVEIWLDQVMHIIILAGAALSVSWFSLQ